MTKSHSGRKNSAYADAGVDIDEMDSGLKSARRMIKSTENSDVLSRAGSFGGLFNSPGKDHALVVSTDGVGTKLKVACMAGKHTTVGRDLVNHCVNDILVQGARPLFFVDYVGTSKLTGKMFKDIVSGVCLACRRNGCAVLGGETAEMPGLYPDNEYDLVGTIVGTVPKRSIVTGQDIREGDVITGFPSSGLHTNGYSLARKVIFEKAGLSVADILPGTKKTVGDTLLKVHKSYLDPVTKVMSAVTVRGMAHITGGGLIDNIPRILPGQLGAAIDTSAWNVPRVFRFIEEAGNVGREEMHRVFNMGIGYVIVTREKDAATVIDLSRSLRAGARVIGRVEKGIKGVALQ
jgi:phosphoribosylformylglycinamidine cyclo-ligase